VSGAVEKSVAERLQSRRLGLSLTFFLAARGLLQSRLVFVLLVVAVSCGVAFQIPNAANIAGYTTELLDQGLVCGFGDLRARARDEKRIEDADAIVSRMSADRIVQAAVPVLQVPGSVGFRGLAVTGVPADAVRLPFRIAAGKRLMPGDAKGIQLGTSLAARLGVRVGDKVLLRLFLKSGGELLDEEPIGRYSMVVRGLVSGVFGVCGADAAVVSRRFLADEIGEPGAADVVLVHIADHFDAERQAQRLRRVFPKLQIRAWMQDSGFLNAAVHGSRAVSAISLAMVLLAVVIPVWALLYIQVLGRQRQVGILRALGFARLDIFAVFLLQAAIIALLGVAIGCAGGYGLIRYFQAQPIFAMEGFVLRPVLNTTSFLWPAAVVFSAVLAAGVLPAWRAARVDPNDVLRGVQ